MMISLMIMRTISMIYDNDHHQCDALPEEIVIRCDSLCLTSYAQNLLQDLCGISYPRPAWDRRPAARTAKIWHRRGAQIWHVKKCGRCRPQVVEFSF